MPQRSPFPTEVKPDWKAFVRILRRQGAPSRVHYCELFLDGEIKDAICERYGLLDGLSPEEPWFSHVKEIRIQRFLGYDYVRCGVEGVAMTFNRHVAADTAGLTRAGGRGFIDEHTGPIANWDEFEAYPWPDPAKITTKALEWYQANLPDDMCVIGSGGFAHFAEHLSWLMGHETLCLALYENPELVAAIRDRLVALHKKVVELMLQFDRVKVIWGSDDMGFRTGPLISPDQLREYVLPGHKLMAEMAHAAGRPYMLHSCGDLSTIMEDLIEGVKIDARHSFEDVIEPIEVAKQRWGHRVALIGGIDVDFLCRKSEAEVRARVRNVLKTCMPGGGYALGTGNSVANYIPVDNYLAMLDEGRKF